MTDSLFSKPTVETLARRAGNRCSNPDCGAITSGPAEAQEKSINIGEAAHIYGARAGSARFKDEMGTVERSKITNGIWLCRNCHKIIDTDTNQYPAEVLFEWRRQHEAKISELLGKPSEIIRQKILTKNLQDFSDVSYLAQQIIIDKPDYWEYQLTAELLRTGMAPLLSRYRALERGLYTKAETLVSFEELPNWLRLRSREGLKLIEAFKALVTEELLNSWGPPGQPGDEREILRVCRLLEELSDRILQHEEAVRFSLLPKEFTEVQSLMLGMCGQMLHQLARLPTEIAAPLEMEGAPQECEINIKLDMPDGWSERFDREMHAAFAAYSEDHN